MPLAVYGLVTGVLAVGAGALVMHAERQLGELTKASSLLATVLIAVVAALSADWALNWLLPPNRSSDPSDSGAS